MMKSLDGVSDEDLAAELERRKRGTRPKPLENPDFARLAHMLDEGFKEAEEAQYLDDDFKHYVYECAVECLYGEGFWEWRRKQSW